MDDNGWTLAEEDNSNLMVLNKSVDGQNVSVYFTSRSPPMEDEEGQGEEEGEEYDAEDGFGNFDLCEFTIYIEKNQNQILAIDALTLDGDLQINTCNIINDITTHRNLNPFSASTNNYKGPEFQTLDETLQMALFDYIGTLGINEEFSSLIEMQSLDKEQRLYMNWLENVNDFLN